MKYLPTLCPSGRKAALFSDSVLPNIHARGSTGSSIVPSTDNASGSKSNSRKEKEPLRESEKKQSKEICTHNQNY